MTKKLLTFLTLLTLFFGVGWAEETTFTLTGGSGGTASTYTQGSITLSFAKGSGSNDPKAYNESVRFYNKNTLSINTTTGTITKVVLTFTTDNYSLQTNECIANSGSYRFDSDYTEGIWTGNSSSLILTSNKSSQARISKAVVTVSSTVSSYTLTLPTGLTGGTVTATGASDLTAIPSGTSMTVTATPSSDSYELDWMKANGTDVSNPYTFNITANTTITAAFKEKSVTPGGDGYFITFGDNGTDATTATTASILKSEYTITGVEYVDSYEISNFVAKGETGLKFASNKNPGTLTINLSAAGQAINAQKVIVKAYGSNKTMNVTINNGTSVSKTVTSSYADYEFDANGTISTIAINAAKENAIHVKSIEIVPAVAKTYDVTVTQAEGGTITASPVGEKVVDDGDKINVTATPNPGYELTGWTITGASESAPDANNQITATGNVTITATFALAKNEIAYTIAPANSGEVWLQNGATYDQSLGYSYSTMGTTVSIALAAYPGYDVNSLAITDATGATVSYTTYNSEWNDGKWVTYYTFVMPATAVNIAATFKSGDIYILGTANDNPWDGNKGVKMTYNAGTNTYSADVYFASETATGKGQFSFASNLSGTDGSWNNIGKRWGAQSQDYDLVTNAGGGNWTENNSDPNRFTVPYGVYTITVNWGTGLVTATKKDISVTLDKAAGQLETGTTVNVVSNLTSLLSACKSGVSATLAYSTNDGANYTDGSSFAVNSAMTAKGKAYYGTIEAESDAYAYTVVTHYAVTATANPENGGTVSVSPASALAGETVTITATPKSGYQLESITVNGTALEAVDGVYSFTMPAQATEVIANFTIVNYTITPVTTNCSVDVASTAVYNSQVTFTVTPRSDKYEVSTVTVTYGDGRTKPVTDNGDGTYSFYMPDDNVTLTVVCTRKSTGGNQFTLVKSQTDIVAGGEYVILNAAETQAMTKTSSNNYDDYSTQYNLDGEIVTLTEGSDVSILKFIDGSTTGTFKIQDGNLYLTAANKKLNATANGSDWTVTLGNNNNVTIQSGEWIIRNNSNYFRCYSTSTGSLVKLYKRLPAGVSVEIDPTTGSVIGSQVVNIGSDTDGALVQYKVEKQNGSNWDVVTDWTEWTTYTEANGPVEFTITGNVGDVYQVTARAKEAGQEVEPDEEEDFDEQTVQYTFVAPNAPVITPASCSITSETQSVTITSDYANGTIEYSTDGGTTWNAYTGQFNVVVEGFGESKTVQARVTYNGVTSEIASATYTRGVQPVVFSPANGTYYGDQTCQMFSTTKGARIYYTMTEDGSEPADPKMNTTGTQLYTGEIPMTVGNTYNFKAVAYIGTTASVVTPANYTIKQESEYVSSSEYDNNKLYSVAELNAVNVPLTSPYYTTDYYEMVNPVQVIYMSTYKQNGYQPEFCLVRDNTGYGMIYFGKQNSAHNNFKVFEMGDWIGGGYSGQVSNFYDPNQQVLSDTHPELGRSGSGQHIYNWVTSAMSNSTVLPEYLTISEIQSSDPTGSNADYWGHYVHLRKTTVELVQSTDPGNYTTGQDKDGKWSGTITDEDGQSIMYYDKFYLQCNEGWTLNNNLFTGHPNRTFDVYGFVACYKNVYQISPFDFAWIDQPVCDHETDTYTTEQTVTLSSPDDPTATIWYKTDDMDDYHVYTEPFTVNSTTTVSWYATKQSQYNDELESKKGTITMTFATINPPVIAPESQVKAVGSESVNSTITRDNSDGLTATIWFTIDGSDPSDPSSDRYEYNTTNQATMLSDIRTTTTVRAIAEVDGIYSAEAEARTYTFVKSNGIVYDLVTSVSQLNENGVYVIVSQNHSEALSTTQNTTNRGAAGVLFVEETNKAKVYGNDDVAQFTLTVLTHDEDTSPERHFLMQTNNSSQNGYLYVGHDVQNTLMTEAEEDAMGNDVAVITIDADGRAHIHFNYAGGDNRYLQYWNRDRLFNTYKSEYDDRAVYIYGVNATPLATIEKEGTALPTTTTAENQYTVADQLIAVHYKDAQNDAGEHYLWCKDQGNVSISKTEKTGDDQIDYLKDVTKVQNGDWDQSNWVVLKFTNPTNVETISGAVGKYINPASITGHYTDGVNFTITLPDGADLVGKVGDAVKYTPNVYCPVNFLDKNLNIGGGQGPVGVETGEHYFFMNPKIQEVATVTYAVWNGTCFVIPAKAGGNNQGDFDGAFSVAWTYNAYGDQKDNLQANTAYRFLAVLNTGDAKLNSYANTGAKAGENAAGTVIGKEVEPQAGKVVYALDLNGGTGSDNIITAIQDVADGTGKAVAGVKYYNLAGIESDRPFEGVNIIVTTYTDGSRSSSKVLK